MERVVPFGLPWFIIFLYYPSIICFCFFMVLLLGSFVFFGNLKGNFLDVFLRYLNQNKFMKKLMYGFSVLVLASCSSNKYAAHFTHYDRHENYAVNKASVSLSSTIEPEMLTASLNTKPVLFENQKFTLSAGKASAPSNRHERKLVKAEIKKDIKQFLKQRSGKDAKVINASGSWDQDLKMAAIFGAVGLVAMIIGTTLFNIIGAISLIIGVVFLIKWIIRQ